MHRIIAATDLTRRSGNVIGRTARLARVLGARVLYVTVTPKHRGGMAAMARTAFTRSMDTETALARLRAEAEPHDDVTVECRVLEGRPDQVLSRLATTEAPGLMVLGLHRERRVLDVLRLTTMERVVLGTDVPVLIAHRAPVADYSSVLGAVTFSPTCARALEVAARLAPDATFHAIHALQMPLREKLAQTDIDYTRTMTEAEVLRDAFCAMPGVPCGLAPPEIVNGGLHEVLRFRIEELRPDLLAIGTHSGRDPATLGNYTRDLMRAPPADVLVVKPPLAG